MDRNDLIGERIRKRRVEKGYTQKTLAQAMTDICSGGVHEKSIAAWENGEGCKTRYIPDLCEVLDCDTEYLFGYCATPHKETSSAMKITGLSERAVDSLIKNKPVGIPPKDNDILMALNTLIESDIGMHFLSAFHDYVFGNYQWINLFGDDSGTSYFNNDDFKVEIFEKRTFSSEVYGSEGFIKMLRNSKMAKMQELLIKLRDETDERGNSSGKH